MNQVSQGKEFEGDSHGPNESTSNSTRPERVLQIGEGKFLRGFFDWLMHQLNEAEVFRGSVVVVAPRKTGAVNIDKLNAQRGVFTVWTRGIWGGDIVDSMEAISVVSRGIDPYKQWEEFLSCAEQDSIDIIVSNTTESGIQYHREERVEGQPIESFPGKITAYLYRRYVAFDGDPLAGMTVVPCELIENNGTRLRDLVLNYARDWNLPESFQAWIRDCNHFCNTLVDRIVTSPPPESSGESDELTFRDNLITVVEPYYAWVIEADDRLRRAWPFEKLGLNARYVPDVEPYRTQKVRILNGAHTSIAAIGLLSGFATVQEVVDDSVLGTFLRNLIYGEIVPTLTDHLGDEESSRSFANSVIERFGNPYMRHELQSLTQSGLSKIRARVLPTLFDYALHYKSLPPLLCAGLAAQLMLYDIRVSSAHRISLQDDPSWIEQLQSAWSQEREDHIHQIIAEIVGWQTLWGPNLRQLTGLVDHLASFVQTARRVGVRGAVSMALATT